MFTEAWLTGLIQNWNSDRVIRSLLKLEKFSAAIGYGLTGKAHPSFVLVVKEGLLSHILKYNNQSLDWDLRASSEDWQNMIDSPPNITQLGMAYSQKRLICCQGDYSGMVKNINLSRAFVQSFKIMNQANVA